MLKVGDKVRIDKDYVERITKHFNRLIKALHASVPSPFVEFNMDKIYTITSIKTITSINDKAYYLDDIKRPLLVRALIPVITKTIKIKPMEDILATYGITDRGDGYIKIGKYVYYQKAYILAISGREIEAIYDKETDTYKTLDILEPIPKEIIISEPKYKIVAVEFDGVLGRSINNPLDIDEVYIENVEILKKYQKRGGKVILFTRRKGKELLAVARCMEEYGLMFDAINMNVPDNHNWNNSPKVSADLYIDADAFPAKVCGIDWNFLKKELLGVDENV